jgi:hypothetical protein
MPHMLYATLNRPVRLRSPRELRFRLHQLAASLMDYALPAPSFDGALKLLPLPEPGIAVSSLRGSRYALEIRRLAESILRHDFPIFDQVLNTGPEIDWRRDYHNGVSTPAIWHRRIPFLDFAAAGDHKYVWELNRHQHLVTLAQAWVLTSDARMVREIESQISAWSRQNPFLRSINWASSLELAFRALSWMWVLHLAGPALQPSTRTLLGTLLLQHGIAISHNLSTYFAPNTHILGEAVALHALGIVLGRPQWRQQGASIVDGELLAQVQPDGFHFEQSSYYHLYALDMFLFHYILSGRPAEFAPVLQRMARAAAALMGSARTFPMIGDDDGGRFFHPYGERVGFANATLATCAALFPEANIPARRDDFAIQGAWWLGAAHIAETPFPDSSEHLESCGLSLFRRGSVHITFDCGPFSRGGAGHSHADTLALTLRIGDQQVLTDPGTYTYVGDREARDWFRGTGAHSTLRLGARDQADPIKPFQWANPPAVRRLTSGPWQAAGECRYRDWTHVRNVDWMDHSTATTQPLHVSDMVSGPGGADTIEQIWHSGEPITRLSEHAFALGSVRIEIDRRLRAEIRNAWRSPVFGSRLPSFILHCTGSTPLASPLETAIFLPPGNGDGN